MHPERSKPQLGISYDSLSAEVRPYADNLEAQIWAVFAKYGIVVGEGLAPSHSTKVGEGLTPSHSTKVGEGLAPSHTGGDKPRPYILDELKAANPSTEDLEHLADLLDQLDHIRKIGEPMPRTKREYPHLYLETQLKEAREILGAENVIGPEEVASVWFPDTLSPRGRGQGEGASFEITPIPYSKEDLEKAKELGMFLILRISHDQEGRPLTPARMNELIQPRLEAQEEGKLLYDTSWYKDEPFFTDETPTTPSAIQRPSPLERRGQGEGGLPRAEWKLVTKDLLPDSTDKDYLEQTKLLRDALASAGWLTDEEASEVTDLKLEAIRPLVESDEETQLKEAARILSQLKLNQNHRRTFSHVLYDTATFFLTRDERLLENRFDWTQTRSSVGLLVALGHFDRDGVYVDGWHPWHWDERIGVVFSH